MDLNHTTNGKLNGGGKRAVKKMHRPPCSQLLHGWAPRFGRLSTGSTPRLGGVGWLAEWRGEQRAHSSDLTWVRRRPIFVDSWAATWLNL